MSSLLSVSISAFFLFHPTLLFFVINFFSAISLYKAVDHPYLVIHSDTQRDKGQDALVLAETNAAAREKEKDKITDIKIAGKDADEEAEILVSTSLSARES